MAAHDVREMDMLCQACAAGNVQEIRVCLHRGANANGMSVDGHTPLVAACGARCTGAVKLLLAHGADPNKACNNGMIPLAKACEAASLPIAKVLMKAGARVDGVEGLRQTALHYACTSNALHVAELLIDKYAADVDCVRWDGETPVMLAARLGEIAMLELLLSRGADPSHAASGCTALHFAAFGNAYMIVLMLLRYGVDKHKVSMNNDTALDIARRWCRGAIVDSIERSCRQDCAALVRGTHARLGAESPVALLRGFPQLTRFIVMAGFSEDQDVVLPTLA